MGAIRPRTMPQGTKLSEEWLPAGSIVVDSTYERPLSEPRVRKIIAQFDPDLIGALLISRRDDGTNVIIDGQHRREAIIRSWGPTEKLPCLVYHGLSVEQEARIFAGVNRGRTKPKPMDLFRADLVSKDPTALGMAGIAAKYELSFGSYPNPNVIGAVGAVRDVYTKAGPDVLDETLGLLTSAQMVADHESLPGELITAVALLIVRYGHRLDRARLRLMLLEVIPRRVIANARSVKSDAAPRGVTLGIVIAEDLLTRYNKGRRGRRVEWEEPTTKRQYWKPIGFEESEVAS